MSAGSYTSALRQFRLGFFLRAVADADGNMCAAAKAVGVHRNLIWRVLNEAGYSAVHLRRVAAERRAQVRVAKGKKPVQAAQPQIGSERLA